MAASRSSRLLVTIALLLCTTFKGGEAEERTIDDADLDFFDYDQGLWNAVENQGDPVHNGTLHYSNDPSASYTFNFTGTSFEIMVGKKDDRGEFVVDIDDIFAGTGDALNSDVDDDSATPEAVYMVENLDPAEHMVTVWNFKDEDRCDGGVCFLAIDFLRFQETEEEMTVSMSGSPEYPKSMNSGNPFDGGLPSERSDDDSTNVGAIVGGTVGGVAALLLSASIVFTVWFAWKRQKGPFRRPVLDEETGPRPTMQESPYNDTSPFTRSSGFFGGAGGAAYMTTNIGSRFHEEHGDAFAGSQPPSYDMAAPTSAEGTGTGTGNSNSTDSASARQSNGLEGASTSGHDNSHSSSSSTRRPLSQGSAPPAGVGGRLFKGAIQ